MECNYWHCALLASDSAYILWSAFHWHRRIWFGQQKIENVFTQTPRRISIIGWNVFSAVYFKINWIFVAKKRWLLIALVGSLSTNSVACNALVSYILWRLAANAVPLSLQIHSLTHAANVRSPSKCANWIKHFVHALPASLTGFYTVPCAMCFAVPFFFSRIVENIHIHNPQTAAEKYCWNSTDENIFQFGAIHCCPTWFNEFFSISVLNFFAGFKCAKAIIYHRQTRIRTCLRIRSIDKNKRKVFFSSFVSAFDCLFVFHSVTHTTHFMPGLSRSIDANTAKSVCVFLGEEEGGSNDGEVFACRHQRKCRNQNRKKYGWMMKWNRKEYTVPTSKRKKYIYVVANCASNIISFSLRQMRLFTSLRRNWKCKW